MLAPKLACVERNTVVVPDRLNRIRLAGVELPLRNSIEHLRMIPEVVEDTQHRASLYPTIKHLALDETAHRAALFGGPHGSVICIDRWLCAACGPCVKEPGVQMRFGFIASFVMAILAIVGVFIDIPIVSQYAFWFVVGAYILLAGSRW